MSIWPWILPLRLATSCFAAVVLFIVQQTPFECHEKVILVLKEKSRERTLR